jgi:hypothetical protein
MHPESKAAQYAEQQRLNTFMTSPQVVERYGNDMRALGLQPESFGGISVRVIEATIKAKREEETATMEVLLREEARHKSKTAK